MVCLATIIGFGSTTMAVDIATVPVGNVSNSDDTTTHGAVNYAYNMGKYEVTAGQYRDFLNAVDPNGGNTDGLYNGQMNIDPVGCQITWNAGLSTYDFSGKPSGTAADWEDRPVNYVSWFNAAMYANWATSGNKDQGAYNTGPGAGWNSNLASSYNGITAHDSAEMDTLVSTYGAVYVIPTEDEWYKAAYYDGSTGSYYNYPTSSDTLPGYIDSSGDFSRLGDGSFSEGGTDPGNYATYNGDGGQGLGIPYYRTNVGEHENSASPYGTFDQGGNIWEWNDAIISEERGLRGGGAYHIPEYLASSHQNHLRPWLEYSHVGFRIAEIGSDPEPEPALKFNGTVVDQSELQALITPLLAPGDTLSGWGVYDGAVIGAPASSIIADDGDMTLGDGASYAGFSTAGTIDTRANTLTLQSAGFAVLGIQTTLGGGTLSAPNGVAIGIGDNLVGSGAVNAKIAAGFGSTMRATGDLVLGDSSSAAGFVSDGELYTGANTVTINDANQAVLGSLTQLGTDIADGTLAVGNGLVVEFGKNISGRGVVDTPDDELVPLINNGAVIGDAPGAIELTGYVKGVGTLTNVTVGGTFSPGLSAVRMHATNLGIGAAGKLIMELGGLSGGSEYDQLVVAGDLTLGGTLQVTLIDGFAPEIGDKFDILDWGSLAGSEFDTVQLPELAGRKSWDESKLYTTGIIEVIAMLYGDTDDDRDVDDDDYNLFTTVFGSAGDWRTDFNEDGRVDLTDFALMRGNFGVGVGPSPGVAPAAPTPEPLTLSILALGGLAIIRRRRSCVCE
jgi:formylglycine-generating enzyme required for sulfatase activity